MNSFNGFANSIRNTIYYVINNYVVYNFPAVDASLVFYYPLDSSNGNAGTANYASGLPVYDASMMGSATNTYTQDSFVTGLGDLNLNNVMGSSATAYVQSNTNFSLVPSSELSISLWFSCNGQDVCGTLISLYQPSIDSSIRLGLFGSQLIGDFYTPPPPVTYSILGGGAKSATNSPLGNVNYIFTTDGSFTIIVPNGSTGCNIRIFLVGGGGGGGGGVQGGPNVKAGLNAGGGGAGQVLENTINITTTTTFRIVIGSGGSANTEGTSTSFGSSYIALGGGYGGSHTTLNTTAAYKILSVNGGGGSYSDRYKFSSSNSTGRNGYTSGSGGINNNYAYGGGGAGAGGNGSNGGTSSSYGEFQDNGGNGITPSNYFYNNNVVYGIGGPTRIGGLDTGEAGSLPGAYTATLWRINNTSQPSSQNQISAPNNTGYGGIGGSWFWRTGTGDNSYDIRGGDGGSGICLISIL